jgi:uncharacterized protein YecE (DUF72 family)
VGRVRIGLSGWDYDGWQGDFYPDGLPRARRLAHVAGRFPTVEVNGTFYALSTPRAFRGRYDAVPAGFTFAIKGSRFITHNKKLAGVEQALANFFASGVLELDDKLGPILWQLPESLRFDADRVDRFLGLLPHGTRVAAGLARRHDNRVREPGYGPGAAHRIRHVLEVRHPSFLCDEMATIARRHGTALACSHSAVWPYVEEITAGFVYLRLHGPGELYASAYGDGALGRWAERIACWQHGDEPGDARRITHRVPPRRAGRDVYVYFDNDAGGHAPRDAARLQRLVGGG